MIKPKSTINFTHIFHGTYNFLTIHIDQFLSKSNYNPTKKGHNKNVAGFQKLAIKKGKKHRKLKGPGVMRRKK